MPETQQQQADAQSTPPEGTSQRRQYQRFDVRLSAEIQVERGVFTAVTRNLSVGGAALECDRPLVDDEVIRLSLFLVLEGIEDERMPPLLLSAQVIWTAEGDDGTFTAGVRFEGITQAQSDWLARVLQMAEPQA